MIMGITLKIIKIIATILMISCKNCKCENNQKNRFCTECGNSLIIKTPVQTSNRITERNFPIGDRYHVIFKRKVDECDKFVMSVLSKPDGGIVIILEFTRNQSLNIIDEFEQVLDGVEHVTPGGSEFEESKVILHRNDSTLTEEDYVGQHLGENYENNPDQFILEISSGSGHALLYFIDELEVKLFLSELKKVLE